MYPALTHQPRGIGEAVVRADDEDVARHGVSNLHLLPSANG